VLAKGCVYLNSTNGETYNHFDAVTIGADSQTVTKSGATSGNRVGFVIIDPPSVARALQATPTPETIVGAAGVRMRVQLEPKHPVALAPSRRRPRAPAHGQPAPGGAAAAPWRAAPPSPREGEPR
jgi:hypothetical protein